MSHIQSPTHAFVTALVGIGGPLVTTIDHMRRHANPDADTIPEVLTRILTDIVDSELDHPPDDLYLAAAVLNATCTQWRRTSSTSTPTHHPPEPAARAAAADSTLGLQG
jgi:hypothetical protein